MDQARFTRAVALCERGQFEEACSEFRSLAEAAEEFEEKAELLLNEARALLALDRFKEAERAARFADRLFASDSPHRSELVFVLAELDSREGGARARRALVRLERLLEDLMPRSVAPGERAAYARARSLRGELLITLNRAKEARAHFEEALALETPKDARFYFEFGRTCYKLKEYARANALLAQALSGDLDANRRREAHYLRGIIQVRRGAYAHAVNELSRCEAAEQFAGASHPAPRRENTLLWLAWLSAQLGQKEEAEEYLRRAEACRPGEAPWRRSFRRIFYRLQRRGLALVFHSWQ